MLSFSRRDVSTLMAKRGFGPEDRAEGFALLDKAVGRDLAFGGASPPSSPSTRLIEEIDAWENVWFDVADAALARSFPSVHAKLLDRLTKTRGQMVLVNVKVFLDRLAQLEASDEGEDQAALKLLAKRGLDEDQRAYAAGLVDQARSGVALDAGDEAELAELEAADLDEAVAEMWAWYLDWAKTARTVVESKRLQIVMGLSAPSRSQTGVAEEVEDEYAYEYEDEGDDGGGDDEIEAA